MREHRTKRCLSRYYMSISLFWRFAEDKKMIKANYIVWLCSVQLAFNLVLWRDNGFLSPSAREGDPFFGRLVTEYKTMLIWRCRFLGIKTKRFALLNNDVEFTCYICTWTYYVKLTSERHFCLEKHFSCTIFDQPMYPLRVIEVSDRKYPLVVR